MTATAETQAPTQVGVLRSVQVGTPERQAAENGPGYLRRGEFVTSFVRLPVAGPRWLYTTHLDGNAQADRKAHGHPNQAVLMYAAAHYPTWRAELGNPEIGAGGFAENFTVEGLTEENVAVGDVYGIGEAHVRVSGPRYPCSKIERRWHTLGLTARVAATGRTGWYCYTDHEGMVEAGMPITRLASPYPQCTIARLNAAAHAEALDREAAAALLDCPALESFWRDLITKRLRREET